jgi:hypothetical protein
MSSHVDAVITYLASLPKSECARAVSEWAEEAAVRRDRQRQETEEACIDGVLPHKNKEASEFLVFLFLVP